VKSLHYSAAIAKSGITRLPRTRRPQQAVLSSASFVSVAASIRRTKKLSKQLAKSNWQLAKASSQIQAAPVAQRDKGQLLMANC
jgi:hypothetical protein